MKRLNRLILIGFLCFVAFILGVIIIKLNPKQIPVKEKNIEQTNQVNVQSVQDFLKSGHAFYNKRNFKDAKAEFEKGLLIAEKYNLITLKGSLLKELGTTYLFTSEHKKATEILYEALKIEEQVKDEKSVACILARLSSIYTDLGDNKKSIEYAIKAVNIANKTNSDTLINLASGTAVSAFFSIKDYESSLKYALINLKNLEEKLKNQDEMATSLNNIGEVCINLKRYDEAIVYLNRSIDIAKKNHSSPDIMILPIFNLAKAYNNKGDVRNAGIYARMGEDFLKEHNVEDFAYQFDFNETLYRIYKARKQFEKSISFLEKRDLFKDSLNRNDTKLELAKRENEYEYSKKQLADSLKSAQQKNISDAQISEQKAKIEKDRIQNYALIGGILIFILFSGFIFNRFKKSQKQNKIIENQKKEITDSINYARRIQLSLLPNSSIIQEHVPNNFILYQPKDIVSGDFYWIKPSSVLSNHVYVAVADCTGHGVPGAFISTICHERLNEAEEKFKNPFEILQHANIMIKQLLHQMDKDGSKDGMDIALCLLNRNNNKLLYSGANRPLWITREMNGNVELIEYKATKTAIGGFTENTQDFIQHEIELLKGDMIYMFSDGFADQFGGKNEKKITTKRFKEWLVTLHDQDLDSQKQFLSEQYNNWKGNLEQIDDVCVMGIKI